MRSIIAYAVRHRVTMLMLTVAAVLFGFVWLISPAAVFLAGAAMAAVSLVLASLIPSNPEDGREVDFWFRKQAAQAAE